MSSIASPGKRSGFALQLSRGFPRKDASQTSEMIAHEFLDLEEGLEIQALQLININAVSLERDERWYRLTMAAAKGEPPRHRSLTSSELVDEVRALSAVALIPGDKMPDAERQKRHAPRHAQPRR